MADVSRIRIAIFGGDQELYDGKSARVVLRVMESTGVKTLMDRATRQGKEPVFQLELDDDSNLSYILTVSASGHLDTGSIFKAKPGRNIEVRAMLIPENPEADFSQFSYAMLKEQSPKFHAALTAGNIKEADFLGLDPKVAAGALNIESKLRNTTFMETQAVDYIRRIQDTGQLLQDRIFAWFDPSLLDALKASKSFSRTSGNEREHPGFPISYRQSVPYGTMQFSLSDIPVKGVIQGDVDIDLYPIGIGHLIEVLRNKMKGRTDPYTVYSLLFNQGISPLYTVRPELP